MAYISAVYSPAGPSQTLEMPSQVYSVMVSAVCGLGRSRGVRVQPGCVHRQPLPLAQAWVAWLPAGSHSDLRTIDRAWPQRGSQDLAEAPGLPLGPAAMGSFLLPQSAGCG